MTARVYQSVDPHKKRIQWNTSCKIDALNAAVNLLPVDVEIGLEAAEQTAHGAYAAFSDDGITKAGWRSIQKIVITWDLLSLGCICTGGTTEQTDMSHACPLAAVPAFRSRHHLTPVATAAQNNPTARATTPFSTIPVRVVET